MFSDKELIEMITDGESDCVEFTESVKDLDKIRKAMCAFANDLPKHDAPGIIFIGIKDNGDCAGLNIDDGLLRTLSGLRDDGKIFPFPSIVVNKKKLLDCEVAVIRIEPSLNLPVKVNGRCWIRVGPSVRLATDEEERRLTEKRRWAQFSHDMQGVINASVEADIDTEKFTSEYLPSVVSPKVLKKNERTAEEQMLALRLIDPDGIPTVTAILMFGKDTNYWFPGAYVQFVRFDGTKITDPVKDQQGIKGTLPDQLRRLDDILKVNISVALNSNGTTNVEIPDYPYEALRELIRNAVIHRGYEGSNSPVRVYWYTDRVEITSPGGVYGRVSNDTFGTITDYRNPTIADAMKGMGFMEHFGKGISIAKEALEENGNPAIEFSFPENFIIATVKKRP